MSDHSTSHRASDAYLSLNEEAHTTATRSQRLGQQRPSVAFYDLTRKASHKRGPSITDHHDSDGERGPLDEPHFLPLASHRSTLRLTQYAHNDHNDLRRVSTIPDALMTPQMRSMRLIGNTNPRYHWHRYYKTDEELKKMNKPLRKYYERNNYLIAQYLYIDRLLDSSLPHDLMHEYDDSPEHILPGIPKQDGAMNGSSKHTADDNASTEARLKRTPKNLYRLRSVSETSPLLLGNEDPDPDPETGPYPDIKYEDHEDEDSGSRVVAVAIYINLAANIFLLSGKIAVIVLTSSLSVLASLVDAALDFLSTAIVWTTTLLISRQDQYAYPIGRRRLEPVGVLVFSVIMITSFFQVALECLNRLTSGDHTVVELGLPAITIMISTVVVKGFCWFWCRLVKNSSVQALAQDAITDVVFNTFSIIFPLVGFYAKIWWLDALGGLLLSLYVIFNWSRSASEHVRNLCGAAATADERNVLLYLTMRFAKTIRYIQNLQAYHAGDKLNLEVDIVLDQSMNLRDSHDLSESLQYVLESVPTVDRAFVHADYKRQNLPSHMNQQSD